MNVTRTTDEGRGEQGIPADIGADVQKHVALLRKGGYDPGLERLVRIHQSGAGNEIVPQIEPDRAFPAKDIRSDPLGRPPPISR